MTTPVPTAICLCPGVIIFTHPGTSACATDGRPLTQDAAP